MKRDAARAYVSTTNACKLCQPLGAALAYKGVEGCVPFLHGSQGCATYMRRYLISHFREPVDIASSSLGEKEAVMGGGPNLKKGIINVVNKYRPKVVGVATTCLTETIGDDVPHILFELAREVTGELPPVVHAATPSYAGSHAEGFIAATAALAAQLAGPAPSHGGLNVLPGISASPADLRLLKDLTASFGLAATVLPDISDTLDAPAWSEYQKVAEGGTPLADIRAMGGAAASIELGRTLGGRLTAGSVLAERHAVPLRSLGLPVGLRESDAMVQALEELARRPAPAEVLAQRGRLVDAMVDGHKYLFGQKVVVYGEEDLVAGLVSFLAEIGARPVLAASGGASGRLRAQVAEVCEGLVEPPEVMDDSDFYVVGQRARELEPDLILGHSKGQRMARDLGAPLVRLGFPIHDRFGGQRLAWFGYAGTLSLYDRLVNAVLARRQESTDIGYGYM